jgi:hypothetical protein
MATEGKDVNRPLNAIPAPVLVPDPASSSAPEPTIATILQNLNMGARQDDDDFDDIMDILEKDHNNVLRD